MDGKIVSEYKQFNCLGTYDTLSEIGKRKREFVYRGAKVKLRLIVLRTCTCGVISHLYCNKSIEGMPKGGKEGPRGEGPGGKSGAKPPPPPGVPFGG